MKTGQAEKVVLIHQRFAAPAQGELQRERGAQSCCEYKWGSGDSVTAVMSANKEMKRFFCNMKCCVVIENRASPMVLRLRVSCLLGAGCGKVDRAEESE